MRSLRLGMAVAMTTAVWGARRKWKVDESRGKGEKWSLGGKRRVRVCANSV